jgi:hypothetical protein
VSTAALCGRYRVNGRQVDADDERQVRPSTSRLLDPFRLIVAGSRLGDSRARHHRCQSLERSAPIDPMASEPSSTMTPSVAPSNRTYGSSSIHRLRIGIAPHCWSTALKLN